jgi:hypothetical protein
MFNKLVVRVLSQYKTRRVAECFICDKTRTTSLLNSFKNVSNLDHGIGEIIFQNNFVIAEKIKVKVYVNEGKSLSTYKGKTRL